MSGLVRIGAGWKIGGSSIPSVLFCLGDGWTLRRVCYVMGCDERWVMGDEWQVVMGEECEFLCGGCGE
jgi:hypothetical protein